MLKRNILKKVHIIGTNLLTKFHDDWSINVASREFTRFYYSHIYYSLVFQPTGTIFELILDIIGTNLLSKFHEDRTINVASIVATRKHALPPGDHAFQPTGSIFELTYFIGTHVLTKFHEARTIHVASRVLTMQMLTPLDAQKLIKQKDIIGTNLLTKFHEDWEINVASRVKNAPLPGSHVFQPTGIIFELVKDIIGMNLLTEFHEDRTVNVASRVLTRFYNSHMRKNAPPLGSHVFQANITIFELIQDIIKTNLLTKFHEDWTIHVASRVLAMKNAPPLFHDDRRINVTSRGKMSRLRGGHVFQPTVIIFELVQDIIGMNLLTEFHEDRTINVASRVLTRFYYSHIRKNAPPLGSHVFQSNVIIFELIQDINKTNLLTKFHEDWTINVTSRENAPPPGGHVLKETKSIFELIQDIIGTNILTKVLTRKNAPPPGSQHVFQPTGIIFDLVQYIIGLNLPTKFHEDLTINVATRVLTRFYYSHMEPYTEKCPALGSHVF
ncbi:hypothetical protein DPMN_010214 [Dreissena polymorpha]|uniref:Uncharacterized protein n=1 Tax=Dreissena polymorpha TaxID=45954 RepID=A0A9D4S0V1_DREPO|nr:hypothetical protein DPMN_010214 [Dreissena polymorpha]